MTNFISFPSSVLVSFWGCSNSSKEAKPQAPKTFEEAVKQDKVLNSILEGTSKKSLKNSYELTYDIPKAYYKNVVKPCQDALLIIVAEFDKLGYEVDINRTYISPGVVSNFQSLCGLYDGSDGTVIGQNTLNALIIASKAGKDWKKIVAGMNDELDKKSNVKELESLYAQLNNRNKTEATNLEYGKPSTIALIKKAYAALGFNVEGNNLVMANYKFQILKNVNSDRNLAKMYGPATHKALLSALIDKKNGINLRQK